MISKATEDRKSMTIINKGNDNPIAFDSQKAFDKYKQRLAKKQAD